jgi:hypothetical protein
VFVPFGGVCNANVLLCAQRNLMQHTACKAFTSPSSARSLLDMQIRSKLPSIMVAIAFLVVSEQAQAASPAGDLLNSCQSLERGKLGTRHLIHIPKRKGALICWGYMKALQDLSVWADENGNRILGSCPPERTTTLDLIHSFVKYGRSHRRQLPSNAALAVAKAFQQAFPCSEEDAR